MGLDQDVQIERKKEQQEIYDNFVTPLMGTYLNLTKEPVQLQCPACGVKELTRVKQELKWWATEINRIFICLGCCYSCCCPVYVPCTQMDWNHYCSSCSCYLGRAMRRAPLPLKARKRCCMLS